MELIKSLKNKSIVILSLILVLFFFCINSSFASSLVEYKCSNNEHSISAPEINTSMPHYIIKNDYGTYYSVLKSSDGYFYLKGSKLSFSCDVDVYQYNSGSADWAFAETKRANVNTIDDVNYYDISFYCYVYTDVDKSSIAYSPLPVEIPAVETVEQIPQTMVKVLRVLIPVGLVGCGIFLVVLLMRRVLLRLS